MIQMSFHLDDDGHPWIDLTLDASVNVDQAAVIAHDLTDLVEAAETAASRFRRDHGPTLDP